MLVSETVDVVVSVVVVVVVTVLVDVVVLVVSTVAGNASVAKFGNHVMAKKSRNLLLRVVVKLVVASVDVSVVAFIFWATVKAFRGQFSIYQNRTNCTTVTIVNL